MPSTDKLFGPRHRREQEPGQRWEQPGAQQRIVVMLSAAVLAIAGTGYGLIGLLVIILLVVLILRLV